jgi:gliding motility-associated lipoprotein GldD
MKSSWWILGILFALASCGGDELLIPRPIANLRVEFPEREYQTLELDCPYQIELASYMTATAPDEENSCHQDISFGKFNGTLHLSYVPIKNNLVGLIGYSIDKVREHQVKASAIQDSMIYWPQQKVYGTFYEFYGNAATPFQFHYTDSLNHFVRGTVYFNATPNFDSIYPVLQYIKTDLIHLIGSNKWR